MLRSGEGDDGVQQGTGKEMEAMAWCLTGRNGDGAWMDWVVAGGTRSWLDSSV